MTRLRVVAIILTALLAAAVVTLWQSRLLCLWARPDPGHLEAKVVEATQDHLALQLRLLESDGAVVLRKINLDGTLQRQLGLEPPDGFTIEKPWHLPEDAQPSARAMAKGYNEDAHFVGALAVKAGQPARLRFPAHLNGHHAGRLELQYEGVGCWADYCSSVFFVYVNVELPSR